MSSSLSVYRTPQLCHGDGPSCLSRRELDWLDFMLRVSLTFAFLSPFTVPVVNRIRSMVVVFPRDFPWPGSATMAALTSREALVPSNLTP